MSNGALNGLSIVECGRTGASAYAAKLMADLGADVVKVEPPEGDPARHLGPYPGGQTNIDASGTYLYLNTNKRGVALDITTDAGQNALDKLVTKADVLVHDFPPAEADTMKLSYDRFGGPNPRLVMTSIFPFGSTGPERDYNAYDLTLLSAGGWTWLNGWPGRTEMPPLKPYGFQAAYQGGVNAALATMGALFSRRKSGKGQHVEVSIQQCIASILEMTLANWTYMGVPTVRWGQRPIQPVDMFQCKDGGWIFTLCIEEHQWQALVELMEAPEWTQWEVAANRFVRASNWDALRPFMEEWVAQWNTDDLYRAAQAKRVPFAPASTLGDLLDSEHLKARGFFVEVTHPVAGKLTQAGAPYRFGATPWEVRRPAPTLGQHNTEVLTEAGLSSADIDALNKAEVV